MPVFKTHGNIDQLHKNQVNKFKCSWNKNHSLQILLETISLYIPIEILKIWFVFHLEKPWAETMQQAIFNQNFTQMSWNSIYIIQGTFR